MANFSIPASNDAAEDASRLLQRLGFVILALGAPCAEALAPRAIFLFFPIGMALLLVAEMLHPVKDVGARLYRALWSPLARLCFALLAWAALSLVWTPFGVDAAEHLFKLTGTALLVVIALACSRDHMRAAELYLFPIGIVLAMLAILAMAVADNFEIGSYADKIGRTGVALVILLWPAMAGLAARGRNGLARLLMILAAAFIFASGAPVVAEAFFVGVLVLSFAISDLKRTVFDLSALAAAIVALSPLAPAVASALARWFAQTRLSSLSGPFVPLAGAADILQREPLRLFTGHGIDTAIRGVDAGLIAGPIPRVVLFEIWYELGIIGALLGAAVLWLAFRGIGATGAKVAPYLVAAFACDLTLAFLSEDFSQMSWVTLLAVSAVSAGAAARSQYRTTRPSAMGPQASL
jgi:hypothetical protein